MQTGLSTLAGAKGSLSALGTSVINLGTTTKAFLIAHPTSMGFVLGVGALYGLQRLLRKKHQNDKTLTTVGSN